MFYDDGRTRAEIAELLGIRDPERVNNWEHQYRQEGGTAFHKKRREEFIGRPPKKETGMFT